MHPSVLQRHSEHTGHTATLATCTTTQEVQHTLQGLQSALVQGFTEQGMLQGRVSDLSNSFMLVFDDVKAEVENLKEWAINTTGDTQKALGELQQGMVNIYQGQAHINSEIHAELQDINAHRAALSDRADMALRTGQQALAVVEEIQWSTGQQLQALQQRVKQGRDTPHLDGRLQALEQRTGEALQGCHSTSEAIRGLDGQLQQLAQWIEVQNSWNQEVDQAQASTLQRVSNMEEHTQRVTQEQQGILQRVLAVESDTQVVDRAQQGLVQKVMALEAHNLTMTKEYQGLWHRVLALEAQTQHEGQARAAHEVHLHQEVQQQGTHIMGGREQLVHKVTQLEQDMTQVRLQQAMPRVTLAPTQAPKPAVHDDSQVEQGREPKVSQTQAGPSESRHKAPRTEAQHSSTPPTPSTGSQREGLVSARRPPLPSNSIRHGKQVQHKVIVQYPPYR